MAINLELNTIQVGDALSEVRRFPDNSIHCFVLSPPYYALREYGVEGQFGQEASPDCLAWARGDAPCGDCFVCNLRSLFREIRRALRPDGTVWLNLGDTYSANRGNRGYQVTDNKHIDVGNHRSMKSPQGLPPKNMMFVPARVALALQTDGWIIRNDIIWCKPNPMPGSYGDRLTSSHEYLFLLVKSNTTQFWTHRDGRKVEHRPTADYRWTHRTSGEETASEPDAATRKAWKRTNLWQGHDYYFNQSAVALPAKEGSIERELRGRGTNHKNVNGAPGQTAHTMNRPRPNVRRSGGGNFSVKYADQQPEHGGESVRRLYDTANLRDVWVIPATGVKEDHYAAFPPLLPLICILAGCPPGGVVCDPFGGAGTTAVAAKLLGRNYILRDLNPKYVNIAQKRVAQTPCPLPGFESTSILDFIAPHSNLLNLDALSVQMDR